MSWISHFPRKGTLLLLFESAKQRPRRQRDDPVNLSSARIASATKELKTIADDVHDAQVAADASPSTSPALGVRADTPLQAHINNASPAIVDGRAESGPIADFLNLTAAVLRAQAERPDKLQ